MVPGQMAYRPFSGATQSLLPGCSLLAGAPGRRPGTLPAAVPDGRANACCTAARDGELRWHVCAPSACSRASRGRSPPTRSTSCGRHAPRGCAARPRRARSSSTGRLRSASAAASRERCMTSAAGAERGAGAGRAAGRRGGRAERRASCRRRSSRCCGRWRRSPRRCVGRDKGIQGAVAAPAARP